jgi:thiamine-phosphate pyrophosphorylase
MNSSVLRLLDANANRAREALRVLEDYGRFVLNAPELCQGLKALRHELTGVLRAWLPDALLHRDTPGDVGTAIRAPAESRREDLNHVVTAAGKRLGEALRSLEEYLKIVSPSDAAAIEALRYRFYDLEQRLARTLRPADLFSRVRLYVLISESACRADWFATAQAAIDGGADALQLREKNLDDAELLRRARRFVALCRRHRVVSILNDRPDLAVLCDADGVHVGQEDLPAVEVRKLLGPSKIIGVSTHRLEQARRAVEDGADYLGVGPVYPSPTKPRDFVAGLDYARQAAAEIRIPSVAIAGITVENVDEVLATGVRAVAVTAAVAGCPDAQAAARRLKDRIERT